MDYYDTLNHTLTSMALDFFFFFGGVEIDDMLSTLKAKKRKLESTDQQVELEVLLDFLRNTRAEKEEVRFPAR